MYSGFDPSLRPCDTSRKNRQLNESNEMGGEAACREEGTNHQDHNGVGDACPEDFDPDRVVVFSPRLDLRWIVRRKNRGQHLERNGQCENEGEPPKGPVDFSIGPKVPEN